MQSKEVLVTRLHSGAMVVGAGPKPAVGSARSERAAFGREVAASLAGAGRSGQARIASDELWWEQRQRIELITGAHIFASVERNRHRRLSPAGVSCWPDGVSLAVDSRS